MKKEEKTMTINEEKTKIMATLGKVSSYGIAGYEAYFDKLKINIEILFEQRKDVSKELRVILAYLEEMEKDHSIFDEEPMLEEYEGQEVIWPTTLSLWQEDMDQLIEDAIQTASKY